MVQRLNRKSIVFVALLLAVAFVSFANTSMPSALAQAVTSSSITTSLTSFLTSFTTTSSSLTTLTSISSSTTTYSATSSLDYGDWVYTTITATSGPLVTITQAVAVTSTEAIPVISQFVSQSASQSISQVNTVYPDLSFLPLLLVLALIFVVFLGVGAWAVGHKTSFPDRFRREQQQTEQQYQQYRQQALQAQAQQQAYYQQFYRQFPPIQMYPQSGVWQQGVRYYLGQDGQYHPY